MYKNIVLSVVAAVVVVVVSTCKYPRVAVPKTD
jgi:hypothetical protein